MWPACAPSLDWREVNPAESGVRALFPCKPEVSIRPATPTEPGLPAEVVVPTGERTVLQYMIEPLTATLRQGLREK